MAEKSKKAWRLLLWAIPPIVLIFLIGFGVMANNGNSDKDKVEPSTKKTALKPKNAISAKSPRDEVDKPVDNNAETFPGISLLPEKPKVSETAVLEELQVNYNSNVTSVKVNDNGNGLVRIDVYTSFLPEKKVSQFAQGLAFIAADGLYAVNKLCPDDCKVEAYIWPKNREFFLTHATATFNNGSRESESIIINDVLK